MLNFYVKFVYYFWFCGKENDGGSSSGNLLYSYFLV